MQKKPRYVVGIDEVGRGPIAGPVTVCAVCMLYSTYKQEQWRGLTDSKQLSEKKRKQWYQKAKDLELVGVARSAVVSRTARAIDKKGISACIKECITEALTDLELDPDDTDILLDGSLKAPEIFVHQKTIVKGDQKEKIISLASVIAKVTRDAYMQNVALQYPHYYWHNNKGYGTAGHRHAISQHGSTVLHRKSFLKK